MTVKRKEKKRRKKKKKRRIVHPATSHRVDWASEFTAFCLSVHVTGLCFCSKANDNPLSARGLSFCCCLINKVDLLTD